MPPRKKSPATSRIADPYQHTIETPMRPEVGMQAQFRKKKAPKKYRYDDSLDPALSWDGQNSTRELGEWLLAKITDASKLPAPHLFAQPEQFTGAGGESLLTVSGLEDAVAQLGRLGEPFLNWSGKAERLSMDVPTLPLFVHERLSTKAILETLKGHVREGVDEQIGLFGDKRQPLGQKLRPYEHPEKWENRMILGDSLVVMNSLLEYEGMGGKVQMVYIDPPYGVKFGSNFQPFIRKREVKHNDDADLTREPEMVQAYRDTWELGLHSYLTYLRDRLIVTHELLAPTGSVFVQISDENLHHVREVMDEVFGAKNFISLITFQKTSGFETKTLATMGDYLLWYARDCDRVRINKQYEPQSVVLGEGNARWILLEDGSYRGVKASERKGNEELPTGQLYKPDNILSQGASSEPQPFEHLGKTYNPPSNSHWKANYPDGMQRLAAEGRLHVAKNSIQYRRFASDFAFQEIGNLWTDTGTGNFTDDKLYVVQTNVKVLQRCVLLASNPGDLVIDPTCGSGTAAYVSEMWGRRWITIDTSRVPLALARQRLLTATFPWYAIRDNGDVPAAGFRYERKQNRKGKEVGGIVPHITLKSIANNEPPEQEVLGDRPEIDKNVTRVAGPFAFEATIPTPFEVEGQERPETERDAIPTASTDAESYSDRMLDVLKRSPMLRLDGNRTLQLHSVRVPARTLSLSADAMVDATAEGQHPTLGDVVGEAAERNGALLEGMTRKSVAIVFGPENGAVGEGLVFHAAKEANGKNYTHLYVIGFAIEAEARQFIKTCGDTMGIPATYVQATMDLKMGDLLKNMRSSQIFSVCGLPEIEIRKLDSERYEVELLGLDVFDPISMENEHAPGSNVPAWFLDTDYNGLCFHVTQAFFPRTGAWDALKKSLKADYDESLWDHLAGTVSAPFGAGSEKKIAVKVIDARGNELMVVKSFSEATA
jgi:adenine-specific DNA-methyltransferase